MRARLISARAGAAVAAAVFALTACGGGQGSPKDPSPATHKPGSKSSTPATTEEACGDVGSAVKQHLNAPEVADVTVDGQCTGVVVKTKLKDDDMQSAFAGKALCDKAAEVAYVDDVQGVTVIAAAGRELSVGTKGRDCIAEP